MRFRIIGAHPCIRSAEERGLIDKNAADAAFKKYRKEIVDPFLEAEGFCKYKANAYVRVNRIDLLEYIDFQKERYGSKTFTVELAVMPLYTTLHEPQDAVMLYLSHRLGELICRRDVWWDFADEAICAESLANVRDALEQFALPWFHRMANERHVRLLLWKKKLTSGLSVYDEEWLNEIGSRGDCAEIVRAHMDKLGLPRSLIRSYAEGQ